MIDCPCNGPLLIIIVVCGVVNTSVTMFCAVKIIRLIGDLFEAREP